MTFFTILFAVALFVLWKTAAIVPMRDAYVKERLGKFSGVLQPGLHFLIPFVDRIAYKQEMREQVLDIPPQTCITRDNIQVTVDGVVYLKVMDAERASYGIEDYRRASVNLAQTTMRSEIGKLDLHESFAEREKLNEAIVREIDRASDPWGIKVLRYEIRNIEPSAHVVHTLEKAMEAERSRRAEVTLATAHKEATIASSMGRRQEAINLSEGKKQKSINEATGHAREIGILADATAEGLKKIAAAIAKPGGDVALKMRIAEQFTDRLAQVLSTANVSVVPEGLANLQGFFAGLGETSRTMNGQPAINGAAAQGGGRVRAEGASRS